MKRYSGLISEITNDCSSWKDKIFITIDLDWANDEELETTFNLLQEFSVKASILVTHDTGFLSKYKENTKYQFGIHPNFNSLFEGRNEDGTSIKDICKDIISIVPGATIFRSHSTTISSRIIDEVAHLGIKYDLNYYIPYESGISLKPWIMWNGIVKVPYLWEDYGQLVAKDKLHEEEQLDLIDAILTKSELAVMNFHPVHIHQNTTSLQQYQDTKEGTKRELGNRRVNEEFGVQNIFKYVLMKLS